MDIQTEKTQLNSYDYCMKALEYERELSTQFLELGEFLFTIKEMELFKPQWESFNEYCMEFKSLSQGSISKLVNIYAKLIVQYEVPKARVAALGGWSNVAEILPVIESKEDVEEWLQKAEALSRSDLRNEITEKKTGKDMRHCDHNASWYSIKICRVCHAKEKLGDSNDL